MSIHSFTATLVTGALLYTAAAGASEIYRHIDADGNVHYGDRPTGDRTEELLVIVSRRSDPDAVQARIDAQQTENARREEARSERLEAAQAETQARAAAAERAAQCEQHRMRLQTYTESRRLYREDENGERDYLDDNAREQAEQQVRDLIDEYCGQGFGR